MELLSALLPICRTPLTNTIFQTACTTALFQIDPFSYVMRDKSGT